MPLFELFEVHVIDKRVVHYLEDECVEEFMDEEDQVPDAEAPPVEKSFVVRNDDVGSAQAACEYQE